MKKIVSFFLGMALACQMAVPVFAQSGTTAQQTQPNTQQTEQNNTIQSNGQTGANTQTGNTQDGNNSQTGTQTGNTQTGSNSQTGTQTGNTQTGSNSQTGTQTGNNNQTGNAQGSSDVTALPAINSDSYIVMNAQTGQILISKNPDKKQYPSNITKILTTALALEFVDPEANYTVTVEDVFPSYPEQYRFSNGTYVAITQDEVVKIKDLLYGTMIQSVDDTANALADCAAKLANRSVALEDGSTSYTGGFVEMMNEKAKEIGCINTNFVNPHGLHSENHYTTAYDMALITRYALSTPNFQQYFSQTEYTMEPTNKQSLPRNWGRVKEGMMDPSNENYYQGTIGVKVGQSAQANNTAVSVAERNGIRLICVALNCTGSNAYAVQKDMVNLFDYCFNNFEPITYTVEELAPKGFRTPVYEKTEDGVTYVGNATYSTDSDFTVLVHKNFSKDDVVVSSDIPGRYYMNEAMPSTITFSISNERSQEASQYMVPSMAALKLKTSVLTFSEIEQQKQAARQELFQKVLKVVKIVLIILLVLFILLMIIRIHNKRKYKKRIARKKAAQARRRQSSSSNHQSSSSHQPPRQKR